MFRPVLCRIATVAAVVAGSLVLSCTQSPVSPSIPAVDHYGYVEGVITENGRPTDSVYIYTTASAGPVATGALAKSAATEAVFADSATGRYRLTLIEGTYLVRFVKQSSLTYAPSFQTNVVVTAGATVNVPVELSATGMNMTFSVTGRTVYMRWESVGSYYRVYRSSDSANWVYLPSTAYSYTYTTSSIYWYDTVPDYGKYYYRVSAYSSSDSLVSQSTPRPVTVVYKPPRPILANLADSLTFLWCQGYLPSGFTDYSGFRIVVLRSMGLNGGTFVPVDTVAIVPTPVYSSYPAMFLFKDSTCDTGYYTFRFYTLDTPQGRHSDTTAAYGVRYLKTIAAPSLTLYDSLMHVELYVSAGRMLQPGDQIQIRRARSDSTRLAVIDTYTVTYSGGSSIRYKDYNAVEDTLYYSVKLILANGVVSAPSRATVVVHSTAPAAPTIGSVADSGTYLKVTYYTAASGFPVVIWRAHGSDTLLLDTIDPATGSSYLYYRDYLDSAGTYAYAAAQLGISGQPGKRSLWFTASFLNAPPTPTFSVASYGTYIACRIYSMSSVSGYIIKRGLGSKDSLKPIDTVLATSYYSGSTINYYDTVVVRGVYYYSVVAYDQLGRQSKSLVAAVYHTAVLPPPVAPTLYAYSTYVSLSLSFSSVYPDSVFVFRSKGNTSSYMQVAARPATAYSSFSCLDTLKDYGSGVYYYKVKIKDGPLVSDFGPPTMIAFTGSLTTPASVTVAADSHAVRVRIPAYTYPADSILVLRSLTADTGYVPVSVLRSFSTINSVYDSLAQPGQYYYRTVAVYGVLSSSYSPAVTIAFPGSASLSVFTAPVSGTNWQTGQLVSITWKSSEVPVSYVNFDLFKGTTLVSAIGVAIFYSTATRSWSVPLSLTTGSDYRIRIKDYNGAGYSEYGPYFTITGQ